MEEEIDNNRMARFKVEKLKVLLVSFCICFSLGCASFIVA